VWSLILGLVSLPLTCLCGLGVVLAVPAMVLGWRAKDVPGSRAMAVGGIVTGAVSVVLAVTLVVALVTGAVDRPDV
jgi:hypothetical protein